jgi:hypothetical protein
MSIFFLFNIYIEHLDANVQEKNFFFFLSCMFSSASLKSNVRHTNRFYDVRIALQMKYL